MPSSPSFLRPISSSMLLSAPTTRSSPSCEMGAGVVPFGTTAKGGGAGFSTYRPGGVMRILTVKDTIEPGVTTFSPITACIVVISTHRSIATV